MASSDSIRPVVLVAIDWYLPAFRAGGPIRSVTNLVATLGDVVDFRIVCGNRDLGTDENLDVSIGEWTKSKDEKAHVLYLPSARQNAETWQRIFREVQPDMLYLNSLYSGPFSRMPWRVARTMGLPTTLAPRGMLGTGALSIKPWRKRAWLWLQKLNGRYRDIRWHASTEQEATEIRSWFPKANIKVALNLPVPFHPMAPSTTDGAVHLLSVGRVHPIKNYAFGLALAHQLSSESRPVHYRIVGPLEDRQEVDKLNSAVANMPHVQLELAGPVAPTEMRPHFEWSQLVLVPSFNENYGHAVAEAVAHARPALVSDQTAWSDMNHGDTVKCLPLEQDRWVAAAEDLLKMDHDAIVESTRTTHGQCLLSADHLAAQRALFP